MLASTLTLDAEDGTALAIQRWLPDKAPPKAAVQIIHGLAEHAQRYQRLAAALTAAGYAVYASDLRGHGRTATAPDDLGFFAERGGWRRCLDDLWQVNRQIAREQAGLPIFVIGHSMGSALAQHLMAEHGEALAGVVLSGSGGKPSALATVGRLIARIERLRLGPRGRSALIHALSFGAFNKRFAPSRTPADWLSRDPAEVDKYVADPLCGFVASTQLWIDLLDAAGEAASPRRHRLIPKRLPIHVISGSEDPVSDGTKQLEPLLAAYRAAGLARVTHRFYAGGRHELFNETNRNEVSGDLRRWLDEVVAARAALAGSRA